MNNENSTPIEGGGDALPATPATKPDTTPAPKNDAEAALQEQAEPAPPEETPEAKKAAAEAAERKKNRTRDYINRINREAAENRQRVAELEARLAQAQQPQRPQVTAPASDEPTLEQYDFDPIAFQRAHSQWAVNAALKQREETDRQRAESTKQTEILSTYEERISTFADAHPDFQEVVGSIPYPLHPELQLAIMAHEKGPEIAYHLGNNDDDAFALASIQPHLVAAAVQRLASRLPAAPSQVPTQTLNPNPIKPKPISSAPPPAPSVSGRSATDTPSEKLTDDEWYKRDADRRRKR